MNLDHVIVAVRTRRIPADDAAGEVLDDSILHQEALVRRIIGPGSGTEQHAGLLEFFKQVAEQET